MKVMDEVEVAVPSIRYCCSFHILPVCVHRDTEVFRQVISNAYFQWKGVKSFIDKRKYRILSFLLCNLSVIGKGSVSSSIVSFTFWYIWIEILWKYFSNRKMPEVSTFACSSGPCLDV